MKTEWLHYGLFDFALKLESFPYLIQQRCSIFWLMTDKVDSIYQIRHMIKINNGINNRVFDYMSNESTSQNEVAT